VEYNYSQAHVYSIIFAAGKAMLIFCAATLTFPLFLQEFLKGQIVVSVTNVKKMIEKSVFPCVAASEKQAKSVNVKFS